MTPAKNEDEERTGVKRLPPTDAPLTEGRGGAGRGRRGDYEGEYEGSEQQSECVNREEKRKEEKTCLDSKRQ